MIHIDRAIGREPGEFSAREFRQSMPPTGEELVVILNSEGGSCFEALAICDLIGGHQGPSKAVVSAAAFSAASLVACSCDRTEVTENGYMMLHNPYMDNEDTTPSERSLLASLSDRMVAMYRRKTGQAAATIKKLMEAETFLDATESTLLKFADAIQSRTSRAVARVPMAHMKYEGPTAKAKWQAALDSRAGMTRTAAIISVDRESPHLRLAVIAEANRNRR